MNKDKSQQTGNFILILVAMGLGVLAGIMFADTGSRYRHAGNSTLHDKMDEVMELVESDYVDLVDTDSLSERLLAVMLAELDPHSTYLSARETERTNEMMRGTFEGVGLLLHREGDTTYVGQVIDGGPSDGIGIQAGDMIVNVDGERVSGVDMPADSVVARLRGPRRSKVTVEVNRNGKPLTFTIQRGIIDHKTLPYAAMLDDTTGYIMLTSFSSTSHDEFRDALQRLKGRGMRHLIFDLRGNGGGSLASAIGIAGELLPKGSLIVYTQGAHSRRNDVKARSGGLFTSGRVTVMIDESSASASEVVSGALQDNDRATIVGRRSFGKGLVQTDFELSDGSSVLLTTARYYTPSGRCIQRPYSNGTDEYYRSYMQQLVDEAYADSATAAINDSTPYYTVGGRTVYGGGGITPDIILTYRKDPTFVYYNKLASAGIINAVAFDQVKKNAARLTAQYPNADAFCRGFVTTNGMIDEIVRRGEQKGIARDDHSLQKQRRLMATMVKAYIGQALYNDEVFYRIYRDEDEDLKRILKK